MVRMPGAASEVEPPKRVFWGARCACHPRTLRWKLGVWSCFSYRYKLVQSSIARCAWGLFTVLATRSGAGIRLAIYCQERGQPISNRKLRSDADQSSPL